MKIRNVVLETNWNKFTKKYKYDKLKHKYKIKSEQKYCKKKINVKRTCNKTKIIYKKIL